MLADLLIRRHIRSNLDYCWAYKVAIRVICNGASAAIEKNLPALFVHRRDKPLDSLLRLRRDHWSAEVASVLMIIHDVAMRLTGQRSPQIPQ